LLTCYSPVRRSVFPGVATSWTSLDLHVLSTPPAFVLSQDQTLHRDLGFRGPEPTWPKSVEEPPSVLTVSPPATRHWIATQTCCPCFFTQCIDLVNARDLREGHMRPHWLLTTTVPFSKSDGPGDKVPTGGNLAPGPTHLSLRRERPCQFAGPVGDLRLPAGNQSKLALPGTSVKPPARRLRHCDPFGPKDHHTRAGTRTGP
jgi:hypothetical protein